LFIINIIAPIVIPENPAWLNPKPTFDFELTQHKKSETNPLLIQQHFAEIRSVTSEYSAIYTDGSHTKFDTSVFKGRLVCFNIQTLNWICPESSK
jgi:hypothetical protein